MKILIIGHRSGAGGAENAMRNLIKLLMARHEIHVLLPSETGSEPQYYNALDIQCHYLPLPICLPDFSEAILYYSKIDFEKISNAFKKYSFDLIISNTIATLQGALISRDLDVPHLVYAHESLDNDELVPTAISKNTYIDLVEEGADGIISCSDFVSKQFRSHKHFLMPVLEPFNFKQKSIQRPVLESDLCVIQVIGTQSTRKNQHFAVMVSRALFLRGLKVRIDFIGSKNSATSKLMQMLQKHKIYHRVLPHLPDPYRENTMHRVLTLVCSTSEPYGLTIPESLMHGIPVIATRSGGTSEILPPTSLFEVDDLNTCVRMVEEIFSNYSKSIADSEAQYRHLCERDSVNDLEAKIDLALKSIYANKYPSGGFKKLISSLKKALAAVPCIEDINRNIASAYLSQGLDVSPVMVAEMINYESKNPGSSVIRDIESFDVVPFSMSPSMDELYKYGMGLAIELAANYDSDARLQMASFIICSLINKSPAKDSPIKVLAFGDGIGVDTIRLSFAGFDVDYIDYDNSNMSLIANLNFDSVRSNFCKDQNIRVINSVDQTYDAIVCLELLEHVSNPVKMLEEISGYLNEDGFLYISECFNGIESKWPTHLFENEKYSGLLPLLMPCDVVFSSLNRLPFGKPYLFKKNSSLGKAKLNQIISNKQLLINLIDNQLNVGL